MIPRQWELTEANMALLQGLPAWSGTLDISDPYIRWPLDSAEYDQLATHVPTSYTEWRVFCSMRCSLMDDICEGVNARREGLGLPPLALTLSEHVGRDVKRGEHVVIKPRSFADRRQHDVGDGEVST